LNPHPDLVFFPPISGILFVHDYVKDQGVSYLLAALRKKVILSAKMQLKKKRENRVV
jgi:hypothetical protein